MAEEFVEMVTFRADGLDEIDEKMKGVKVSQDAATAAAAKYQKQLEKPLPTMEKIFRAGIAGRAQEAKNVGAVVRQVERLNKAQKAGMEYTKSFEFALAGIGGHTNPAYRNRLAYNPSLGSNAGYSPSGGTPRGPGALSRAWSGGGSAAFHGAGAVLGATALAGTAIGTAGLSDTVPMARFNNAKDRFAYELGNTLTPVLDDLTHVANNSAAALRRQDRATQNLIGYGLAGGSAAIGTNFLSKRLFGMGIGGLGMSAGRGLLGAGRFVLGGATPMVAGAGGQMVPSVLPASLSLDASAAAQATTFGGRFAARAGAAGGVASRFAGPLGVLLAGAAPFRAKANLGEYEGADANASKYQGEYAKKFAGLTGKARTDAILKERIEQAKKEREGIHQYYGEGGNLLEQMGEMALSLTGMTTMGSTKQATEAKARDAALRDMLNGKGGAGDHRQNAMVGGDFREIGGGYYEAASALAKSGYEQANANAEGGGKKDESTGVLEEILRVISFGLIQNNNNLR